MKTVGEAVSRVRNIIKAVDMDDFITDRVIYSLIMKYAGMYIKRQSNQGTGTKFSSMFKRLPCIPLIDVDKVEACCDPRSGCTIKRTQTRIPNVMEGPQGPLLRTVTSMDGFTEAYRTTPTLYNSMTKTSAFKYNKNTYFWLMDNYIYIPNVEWDGLSVEGIFDSRSSSKIGRVNRINVQSSCKGFHGQMVHTTLAPATVGDLFILRFHISNNFLRVRNRKV